MDKIKTKSSATLGAKIFDSIIKYNRKMVQRSITLRLIFSQILRLFDFGGLAKNKKHNLKRKNQSKIQQ